MAGMVAGADCDRRHGAAAARRDGPVFTRAYAPSTLGSFLRAFTFGHVRQLDAVASRFLIGLADRTPLLGRPQEPGAVMVDVDDTIVEVHGYAKQGAGFGYSGVRGLNALLATVTTAGVGAGDRGPTAPARARAARPRGAKRLVADALRPSPAASAGPAGAGAGGLGVLRHATWSAPRSAPGPTSRSRSGMDPQGQGRDRRDRRRRVDHDRVHRRGLRRDHRPVDLPRRGRRDRRSPRSLAARRPTRCRAGWSCAGSPTSTPPGNDGQEPCSTPGGSTRSSPPPTPTVLDTVAADKTHRGHAIIEQVHADLKNSALAHLPSGGSPRTPPGWCWP